MSSTYRVDTHYIRPLNDTGGVSFPTIEAAMENANYVSKFPGVEYVEIHRVVASEQMVVRITPAGKVGR